MDLKKSYNYFLSSKILLIIVIIIAIFTSSCNLFFSSPHGRENLDDAAAQITAFTAVPSSDNSVVTMWNWKEPPSWANDDRITEIHIQHSVAGYPENYVFFLGETFTDKNMWQHEWTDIIPGITHYFSLFAMSTGWDNSETWYAPIRAKATLSGKVKSTTASLTNSWFVNTGFSIAPSTFPDPLDANDVIVIEFDIPADMKITSAVINPNLVFGIETSNTELFRIYPILEPIDEVDGWTAWYQVADPGEPTVKYLVDESMGITVSGTGGVMNNFPIDITRPVLGAIWAGHNQLVLRMDTNGITVNNIIWADFLVIEYYE